MTGPPGADLAVLLELDALLAHVETLVAEGDRQRYDTDERYRWVLHRIWIAIGNEAAMIELGVGDPEPWTTLRHLRNHLAHVRLPDIDDDLVWRTTTLRPGQLRARVRQLRGL